MIAKLKTDLSSEQIPEYADESVGFADDEKKEFKDSCGDLSFTDRW